MSVSPDAREFGNYELIAKLATGGMAEIFLARRRGASNELVVIKRILPHLAEDEHFVTMFRDEARLASRLIHPNVCRVQTLGHVQQTYFIVMEYLHGVALSRMLSRYSKSKQRLDLRVVVTMIASACAGLQHAHDLRDDDGTPLHVVHRDVSPPNIFVTSGGVVKLLDFGIAKAQGASSKTRTGTVKGKNAYMSPEQILGKPLDRRSDVFALGTVLYELLAVKRLFHRDSDFLTFKAITEEPIPDIRERRPDVPEALALVLRKALARDLDQRFRTARDFGDAVIAAVGGPRGAASDEEIAALVAADFADELTAKNDLVTRAPDAALGEIDPLSAALEGRGLPSIAASSGNLAAARTQPLAAARGNAVGASAGEIDAMTPAPASLPPLPKRTERAPSVIVPDEPTLAARPLAIGGTPAYGRGSAVSRTPPLPLPAPREPSRGDLGDTEDTIHEAMPASLWGEWNPPNRAATPVTSIMPARTPPPPRPSTGPRSARTVLPELGDAGVPDDLTSAVLIVDERRRLLRIGVGVGLAVAALVLVLVAFRGGGDDDDDGTKAAAAASVPAASAVDAAPARAIPQVDANQFRDEIEAISRFGFLDLESESPAVVYIDGNRVGEVPPALVRLPLTPGIHQIKVENKANKKKKRFEVRILGGQTYSHPPLVW